MEKLCKICNKKFTIKSGKQKCCGDECSKINKEKNIKNWIKEKRVAKYKNCKICNKKFEVIGNNRTFCNSACKKLSFSLKYKAQKEKKYYKCSICNKEFESKLTTAKYCSKDCGKKGKKLYNETFVRNQGTNKKSLNRDAKVVFKKPMYENIKYSANEDRAIDVLTSNGFNVPSIAEVLGRTDYSVKHRKQEADIQNFNSPIANNFDKNLYLKEVIKRLGKSQKPNEAISNHIIYNNLIEKGFEIFKVTREGAEFDIVALKDNKFFKIQSKTAGFRDDLNVFRVGANTFFKATLTSKGPVYGNYKYHNIDFFIFNCIGINTSYVIPSSKLKNIPKSSQLAFYPHRSQHMYKKKFLDTEIYKERYDLIK